MTSRARSAFGSLLTCVASIVVLGGLESTANAQMRTWRAADRVPFDGVKGTLQCAASKETIVAFDDLRVRVFRRASTKWAIETTLPIPRALDSTDAPIGAAIENDLVAVASRKAGAAFFDVYERSGASWGFVTTISGAAQSGPFSGNDPAYDTKPRIVAIAGGDVLTVEGTSLFSNRRAGATWTRQSLANLPTSKSIFVSATETRYAFGGSEPTRCHFLLTGKKATVTAPWVPLVQTTDLGSAAATSFCGSKSAFVPLIASQGTPLALFDAAISGDTVAVVRSKFERFIDTSTPKEVQLAVLQADAAGLRELGRREMLATPSPYWRRTAFFDDRTLFVSGVDSASLAGGIELYTRPSAGWSDPVAPPGSSLVSPDGKGAIDLFGEGLCTADDYVVGTDDRTHELVFFHHRLENGATCSSDRDCHTGFCTDGVCCASRCHGDDGNPSSLDCRACSATAGGERDGQCTGLTAAKAPTIVCRRASAARPGDRDDVCRAGIPTCPADDVSIGASRTDVGSTSLSDDRPIGGDAAGCRATSGALGWPVWGAAALAGLVWRRRRRS